MSPISALRKLISRIVLALLTLAVSDSPLACSSHKQVTAAEAAACNLIIACPMDRRRTSARRSRTVGSRIQRQLVAVCHPTRPIEAAYFKADGTLRVRCARCQQPVAVFQIARRNDGVVQ
jgi:hypothetical protein